MKTKQQIVAAMELASIDRTKAVEDATRKADAIFEARITLAQTECGESGHVFTYRSLGWLDAVLHCAICYARPDDPSVIAAGNVAKG